MSRPIHFLQQFTVIFWLGFFMAISFMEAPLKFTAPGITLAEGVAIGRIIFGALNKCEWILLLVLFATIIYTGSRPGILIPAGAAGLILLTETAWLLPALDERALQLINGTPLPHSSYHLWYIALEIAKALILIVLSWQIFKHQTTLQ